MLQHCLRTLPTLLRTSEQQARRGGRWSSKEKPDCSNLFEEPDIYSLTSLYNLGNYWEPSPIKARRFPLKFTNDSEDADDWIRMGDLVFLYCMTSSIFPAEDAVVRTTYICMYVGEVCYLLMALS